jgi:hypothetical protein
MGNAEAMVGGLLVGISCGVVLGIAVLLIVYKMIDGEIPAAFGMGSIVGIVGLILFAVRAPHPAIPAVILVVALALMAFFPFMLNQMDLADLNSYDVERLAKSFQALNERPDNFASKLEVAKALHSQGMVHHAIAIGNAALDAIPTEKDSVKNRSLRDQFKNEEYQIKQWMRTAGKVPLYAEHMRCNICQHENPLSAPVCEKCGNTYLLDAVRKGDNKTKVIGKLVLAWALLALFIVGSASAGLSLSGVAGFGVILLGVAAIGILFAWMFRRPGLA